MSELSPGDKALERVIHDITLALLVCPDPRIVQLQQQAIALRSHEQIEAMEKALGLIGGLRYG